MSAVCVLAITDGQDTQNAADGRPQPPKHPGWAGDFVPSRILGRIAGQAAC